MPDTPPTTYAEARAAWVAELEQAAAPMLGSYAEIGDTVEALMLVGRMVKGPFILLRRPDKVRVWVSEGGTVIWPEDVIAVPPNPGPDRDAYIAVRKREPLPACQGSRGLVQPADAVRREDGTWVDEHGYAERFLTASEQAWCVECENVAGLAETPEGLVLVEHDTAGKAVAWSTPIVPAAGQ